MLLLCVEIVIFCLHLGCCDYCGCAITQFQLHKIIYVAIAVDSTVVALKVNRLN